MKIVNKLLILCIALGSASLYMPVVVAQEVLHQNIITVQGQVTSESGELLPGVSVYIEGSTTGTVTDIEGNYKINIPGDSEELVFSYIGYETRKIEVRGRNLIDVSLSPDLVNLTEIVVIGYGKQSKEDLTGSVSSINQKSFRLQPAADVEQIIQGRTSGVDVAYSSGAPGGDVRIRIRGSNSIIGNNNPLVVIDGVADGDLSTLSTNNIESIEILKDASSTAIYGSRGANGVILVTTKTGKEGKPTINFSTYHSISQLPGKISYLNAYEFAGLYNIYDSTLRYVPGFSYTPAFSSDDIEYFRENEGTDWQDEIFRSGNSHNYDLAVQGGNKEINYYLSGSYLDQEGILINSDYQRYSLNSRIEGRISKRLSFSSGITGSHQLGHNNSDVGSQYSAIGRMPQWVATEPVWDESGEYYNYSPQNGAVAGNPVGLQMTQNTYSVTNTLLPVFTAIYKPFPCVEIRATASAEFRQLTNNYINNNELLLGPTGQAAAGVNNHQSIRSQYNLIANYNKTFGEHTFQATAIYEESSFIQEGVYANATDLNSYLYSYHNLALSASQTASSYYYDEYLRSYAGRVNYDYRKKYFFTSTVRLDGSSKFGDENKYGLFPSFALGWRLSEEDFIKDLNTFSNLKLRASYGTTGSQAVGSYNTLISFVQNSSTDYVTGGPDGANATGLGIGSPGNPYLKWESTAQADIGLEMGFFDGRLNLEADAYFKKTSDLLLNYSLPYYAGNATVITNVGGVNNKGIELLLNITPVSTSDFTWQFDLNFSHNRNKVTDLGDEEQIFPGSKYADASSTLTVIKVGEPLGTFYGYKYLGTWKTEDADEAALYLNKPGDARYLDLNNDSVINSEDLCIIGYAEPDFIYGFNNTFRYKNFDLNIFIQGVQGGQIFNGMTQKSYGLFGQSKAFTSPGLFDRWSPDNNDSDIPAFSGSSALYPGSSRWLEDRSYLRLKNITLAYNLGSNALNSLKISRLQIYVSAVNLYTLTKYTGYDPEVSTAGNTLGGGSQTDVDQNIDTGAYPNPRTFTIGLKATF